MAGATAKARSYLAKAAKAERKEKKNAPYKAARGKLETARTKVAAMQPGSQKLKAQAEVADLQAAVKRLRPKKRRKNTSWW